MDIKIEDGKIKIEMPLAEPKESATGKTFTVGTTGGYKPVGIKHPVSGKELHANVTVGYKK